MTEIRQKNLKQNQHILRPQRYGNSLQLLKLRNTWRKKKKIATEFIQLLTNDVNHPRRLIRLYIPAQKELKSSICRLHIQHITGIFRGNPVWIQGNTHSAYNKWSVMWLKWIPMKPSVKFLHQVLSNFIKFVMNIIYLVWTKRKHDFIGIKVNGGAMVYTTELSTLIAFCVTLLPKMTQL